MKMAFTTFMWTDLVAIIVSGISMWCIAWWLPLFTWFLGRSMFRRQFWFWTALLVVAMFLDLPKWAWWVNMAALIVAGLPRLMLIKIRWDVNHGR